MQAIIAERSRGNNVNTEEPADLRHA
jgi:hypothetical protein